MQSAYLRLCYSGACPALFWSILTRTMRSSLSRASKNFQNVGSVDETFAWKLLCKVSILLFVRGSSSAVRLNMFHNLIENKGERRGAFLRKWPPNSENRRALHFTSPLCVSILEIVEHFTSNYITLISNDNAKFIKAINHILWGHDGWSSNHTLTVNQIVHVTFL